MEFNQEQLLPDLSKFQFITSSAIAFLLVFISLVYSFSLPKWGEIEYSNEGQEILSVSVAPFGHNISRLIKMQQAVAVGETLERPRLKTIISEATPKLLKIKQPLKKKLPSKLNNAKNRISPELAKYIKSLL